MRLCSLIQEELGSAHRPSEEGLDLQDKPPSGRPWVSTSRKRHESVVVWFQTLGAALVEFRDRDGNTFASVGAVGEGAQLLLTHGERDEPASPCDGEGGSTSVRIGKPPECESKAQNGVPYRFRPFSVQPQSATSPRPLSGYPSSGVPAIPQGPLGQRAEERRRRVGAVQRGGRPTESTSSGSVFRRPACRRRNEAGAGFLLLLGGRMTSPPPARPLVAILLGASNLTLGLPRAVRRLIERRPGREIHIFAAHGPGRSFGSEAGIAAIRFTGIVRSGVFEAAEEKLRALGDAERLALVTDVGNDILYRAGPERILGWLEEVIERLAALGARSGITLLPLESLETLPAWKFRLLRPLFYPFRPIAQEEVMAQARRIEEGIAALGRSYPLQILPSRAAWYGADHFHLGRLGRREAFAAWLDALLGGPEPAEGGGAPPLEVSALALRFHPPASYRFFGRLRTRAQPGKRLAPGVWLHGY
jgi:hypothetical protein